MIRQGTLEEQEARFVRRVDTAQGVIGVIREAGLLPKSKGTIRK